MLMGKYFKFFTLICTASLLLGNVQAEESRLLPHSVRVSLTDEMGPLYVTGEGYSLYTWRNDDIANESKCNNKHYSSVSGQGQNPGYLPDAETRPTCEEAWPPLAATQTDKPVGDWAVFERHDKSLQWSLKGKPVYTTMYDQKPGDITGLGGVFYARTPLFSKLAVPMGMSGQLTRYGYTLTDAGGFTLYTRSATDDVCSDQCQKNWEPHLAPALLVKDGDKWSTRELADGRRQWYKNNKALYTFKHDLQPGHVNGRGKGDFSPVILYAPVQPPSDITVQMTSEGGVFADKKGKTLYRWSCFDESPDSLPCDTPVSSQAYRLSICGGPSKCMDTWRPVVASESSKPVGNTWSVIPIDPTGKNQYAPEDKDVEPLMVWAYHGKPVYTYEGDKFPGDIVGHGVRSFVVWGFHMVRSDLSSKSAF